MALMKLAQAVTKTECGSHKGRTSRFALPEVSHQGTGYWEQWGCEIIAKFTSVCLPKRCPP